MTAVPVVAVHAGAGNHTVNLKELKRVCGESCIQVMKQLNEGADAVSAVTKAISMLEDTPTTNAGVGSCLTLHGTVECDASIMRGDGACGIVGAVSGMKNPIQLAHKLLIEQSQGLLSLGRIPPLCLCGDGARLWAETHGMPTCSPDELISECSKEAYLDHMSRLDDLTNVDQPPLKRSKLSVNKEQQLDTVGAVCVDSNGIVSAGCSSGGISLKHPGRVGQAGMFGCGCWAEGNRESDRVAVSTSGVGETLIRTLLAKEISSSVLSPSFSSLRKSFHDTYLDSPFLADSDQKLAGVIVLNVLSSGLADFSWAHSTDNMLICYMTGRDKVPKVILSELVKEESGIGERSLKDRICVEGVSIRL